MISNKVNETIRICRIEEVDRKIGFIEFSYQPLSIRNNIKINS